MNKLLKYLLAASTFGLFQPGLACEKDRNIRSATLALPSDEKLNVFDAGGIYVIAADECGSGIYAMAYPAKLKKAKAGDVEAMDLVGLMLSAGAGVKQNWKEAIDWLQKAAKAGSGEAAYRLGVAKQFGLGTAVDLTVAKAYYAEASAKSIAYASTNLGMMYFQGIGVQQDISEAVRLFELARSQGDPLATQNLASIYAQGMKGIARDEAKAFSLAREAALLENTAAMRLMGYFYANGIGTAQDLPAAYVWSSLAAKRGDQTSEILVSKLQPLLTAQQLEGASKAASKCEGSDFKDCP